MRKKIFLYTAAMAFALGTAFYAASGSADPETVYAGGTGSAEKAAGVPGLRDDGELIYCVGSVSKIYVTTAALRLADEGKIRLDAPVTDYIPEFRMADERYRQITVRMLMNHTSGLMGTTEPGGFLYDDNDTLNHDTLLEALAGQRLKADPGAYAAYCNDGFDLLEILVERVSGMSFTEYTETVLASRTGGQNTGTPVDFCRREGLVPGYAADGILYENGMTMCVGSGGVFATASDVASFGTSFFRGNDVLLSEGAKKEMAQRWDNAADPYHDESGLGWDKVSWDKYEENGVSIVAKGGDTGMNHAWLMVAPEEEISIAVLTNGGSSSLNALLADAVMEAVLSERGIETEKEESVAYEALGVIPEEYERYAGVYIVQNNMGGGDMLCSVSFPGHKYMHTESIGAKKSSVTDYMLTKEGVFAELAYELEGGDITDAKFALNPTLMEFRTGEDGKDRIAARALQSLPGMGTVERRMYVGERLEAAPVSEEAAEAWRAFSGADLFVANDIWSSSVYDDAVARVYMSEAMPGYIFAVTGRGSRILRITDEASAVAPASIPSSSNRDLMDAKIENRGNGSRLVSSTGLEFLQKEDIPYLTVDIREVALKDREASWYRIADEMKGRPLTIAERPENSAVYVYNKYGKAIYSSHIKDASEELPLPADGYIVFLGENGGSIKLK